MVQEPGPPHFPEILHGDFDDGFLDPEWWERAVAARQWMD